MSSLASSSNSTYSNNSYQHSSYLCPSIFQGTHLVPRVELDPKILSWLREALQEGERFIKSQPIYGNLDKAVDLVFGRLSQAVPDKMSKVNVNLIKKNIRTDVATLSNLRPSWIYEANSSEDPKWIHQASILNKCNADWYRRTFVREAIKGWLQYGFTHGIGYLGAEWNPDLHAKGEGNIELTPYGYDDVYHVGMNSDFNHQNSYATIIRKIYDIRTAWKMFPKHRAKIVPDVNTNSQGLWERYKNGGLTSLFQGSANDPRECKVAIYYCYIDDCSINETETPITMGKGSWSYQVPFEGQEIFDKYTMQGLRQVKKATHEDCLLYPNRRLIICTRTAILYDDTSFYWHGRVPLVKYSPDAWIFSYIGKSLALELESANTSFNSMNRGMEDGLNLTLDPPSVVDKSIAKSTAEKSFRVPGRKFIGNVSGGVDMVKNIHQQGSLSPTATHFAWIEKLEAWMEDISGAPSMKALEQARQIPTSDTVEKMFSMQGAVTTDMSQSMDKPIWELADFNRFNFFQFYTKQRRMFLLGETGQVKEDYDPDAGTMIPNIVKGLKVPTRDTSLLHPYNYDPDSLIPITFPNEPSPALSTRAMRAKWHVKNFTTTIQPMSLHEITNMQRKLLLIQASKLNPYLVSLQTLAETLDIPAWGNLTGDTELEKVQSFMKLVEKNQLSQQFHQFLLQLGMQMLAQSQSPEGQIGQGLQQVAGAIQQGAAGQQADALGGGQEGRPSSFNQAPKLTQKSDGRTTIET